MKLRDIFADKKLMFLALVGLTLLVLPFLSAYTGFYAYKTYTGFEQDFFVSISILNTILFSYILYIFIKILLGKIKGYMLDMHFRVIGITWAMTITGIVFWFTFELISYVFKS